MRISPRILTTALLAFCAFAFAGAQSTNDLPKLSEIKGKKLLEKITPLKHKRGMWGYANNEAKFIIKPVFNEACPFEGKVARVKIADKWGTIGSNGLFIVEPLYYERIDPYSSDSLSIAVSAGKFGLINAKGARVQKIMYELIDYADYGYRAKIDGKYCTIDSKGEIILDPRFDQMEMLDRRRGLEQVYMKGKWGVLKDGKDLLTLAFDEKITYLQEGLEGQPDIYIATQKGKKGLVTSYGQFVAPCIYDEISLSSSGQYYVTRSDNKYGAISAKIVELIPPVMDTPPILGEGIFRFHDDGAFYAVNSKGAVSFQDCADLYYLFKPDEYYTTKSIPEWAKGVKIEDNLLQRQTVIDDARSLVNAMEANKYNPASAQAATSLTTSFDYMISSSSTDAYGIADPGVFSKSSGTIHNGQYGQCDLHYKAITASGSSVSMISLPGTEDFMILFDGENFKFGDKFTKYGIQSPSVLSPVSCGALPDDRLVVHFTTPGLSGSDKDHAVMIFSPDSLSAVSYIPLQGVEDRRITASAFGGFYAHSAGAAIVDDKTSLKRYDRNGAFDWEFRARNGERFYDIEETESYIYLCGSTINSAAIGVEVPFIVQLDKHGEKIKEITKPLKNVRFTGVICKDHILYAKAACLKDRVIGPDYYPHLVLDDLGDEFGVRPVCVWEEWGDGVIGGCGLMSHDGKWLNTPIIQKDNMCTAFGWEFGSFTGDHLVVRHLGRYGLVDKNGTIVIEPKYDLLEALDNPSYVRASLGGSYGVLDVTGKVIVPLEYDYVGRMGEDIIIVRDGAKFGCFNKEGEQVVPLEYDDIREYVGGMARIKFLRKFGFINKNGEIIVAPFSDEVENFSEDFTLVTIKNKVGFVNLQGDWLAVPMYDAGGSFSGGYAYLAMGGKYGYINKAGDFAIQMSYSDARDFNPEFGLACVARRGVWGVINTKGREVVPLKFDKVEICTDGNIYVEKGGKCGIFTREGKELFAPECDMLTPDSKGRLFKDGVASGKIGDYRIRIDTQGNIVYLYSQLLDM